MAYSVFITPNRRDQPVVEDFVRRLQQAGATVHRAAIPAACSNVVDLGLRRADEVLIVLTEASLHDQTLMFELGAAYSLRKRITPVLLGLSGRDLPELVDQLPWIRPNDFPAYLEGLEERVRVRAVRRAGG
jgi:TIR domain